MASPRFKTALVLSGGSARGLTHIGVLEELEKYDIPIDLIVGTSMGAVIGGLYAASRDLRIVTQRMRQLVESELFLRAISVANEDAPALSPDGFFNRFLWLFKRGVFYTHSMIRSTLIAEETYSELMNDLIPDTPIEQLPIPFAAVTMDLFNGEEVVIRRGSLRKAVSASAAIPGILPPVEYSGRTLVDGGWVDNVPVEPALALGAHCVIAVDASLDTHHLGGIPTSAIESLFRCNEISRITLTHVRRSGADVVLVPSLGQMFWANFSAMERCISAGRGVVRENIRHIQRRRRIRQLRTLFGLLHPGRKDSKYHPFSIY